MDGDDTNNEEDGTIIFDDCFFLDTEKWEWSKGPAIIGSRHKHRVGHQAICCQEGRIDIFGGRTIGDEFVGDFAHIPIHLRNHKI